MLEFDGYGIISNIESPIAKDLQFLNGIKYIPGVQSINFKSGAYIYYRDDKIYLYKFPKKDKKEWIFDYDKDGSLIRITEITNGSRTMYHMYDGNVKYYIDTEGTKFSYTYNMLDTVCIKTGEIYKLEYHLNSDHGITVKQTYYPSICDIEHAVRTEIVYEKHRVIKMRIFVGNEKTADINYIY